MKRFSRQVKIGDRVIGGGAPILVQSMLNAPADDFNKKIKDGELTNNYGFTTYIRRAYDQGKKHNKNAILDFFKNKNRADLENNVISFIGLHS